LVEYDEVEVSSQPFTRLRVIDSIRQRVEVRNQNLRCRLVTVYSTDLSEQLPFLRRRGCLSAESATCVQFWSRQRYSQAFRRPLHKINQFLELILREHDSGIQKEHLDAPLASGRAVCDVDERTDLKGKRLT